MIYESALWSIEYPDDWEVDQDEFSTSFFSPHGFGALQISAAASDSGDVTDAQLESQATGRIAEGTNVTPAICGEFTGLTASFARENNARREWWLRSGDALLYVTYICASVDAGAEDDAIGAVLQSLRRRHGMPQPI